LVEATSDTVKGMNSSVRITLLKGPDFHSSSASARPSIFAPMIYTMVNWKVCKKLSRKDALLSSFP